MSRENQIFSLCFFNFLLKIMWSIFVYKKRRKFQLNNHYSNKRETKKKKKY